jgi:hypothetical protein
MFALFAALFVILGVPILFLSLPAAAMFWFVPAIWIVVTSIVIGGAWLAFGRTGVVVTSAAFFAFVAWTTGRAVIEPKVAENARCSASAAMTLLPPRITRPARVVFDNVQRTMPFNRAYLPEMVAVVTGAEVVEIERLARGHIATAWSTKVSPGPVCTAPGSRNTIRTIDGPQPKRLDLCLTRTVVLDYSQRQTKTLDFADAAPAILLVANADDENTGRRQCDVFDIYEEDGRARRQLGRFIYDWRDNKLHPDPRKPGPGRRDGAFESMIRAALGEQVGVEALRQHFVSN